jgi:hypothetical protein
MIRNYFLLLLLLTGLSPVLEAQSWRSLRNAAEQAYEDGDLMTAAEKYSEAYGKKRKKEELTYKAGEIYYTLRDYRKAVEAYRPVKDQEDDFPLVGLKYARCLKQDGQYDRAIKAFEEFLGGYTGDGKEILEEIIRVEIAGCKFGLEAPANANRELNIALPGDGVNSEKEDFAPFPISDNELYFSSNQGERARIYVSERENNSWTEGEAPRNFPVIQKGHFCNSAMSPDGNRIYFTVCNNDDKIWDDVKKRCEIFVSKRVGSQWSQPERLPDYINTQGVTATHPYVTHQRGSEIIYFASNREGGLGGMDLWYAARDLGIDNNDFGFPVNLGPVVNTLGDEITPFYDRENQALYFASNGHVSMGGFDIFQATGDEVSWSQPDNMGMPVNSSADEYFYILNPSRNGGFFTSNRVYAGDKITTAHEDIFEFSEGGRRVVLKGNVYDRSTGDPIGAISVRLFEVGPNGESELRSQNFSEGRYSFDILPGRQFRVEVSAYGYKPGSYRVNANDENTYSFGQPIFLEKEGQQTDIPEPPTVNETDPYPGNTNPGRAQPLEPEEPVTTYPSTGPVNSIDMNPVAPYRTRSQNPNDNYEYETTAPRHSGTYYKVQIAAVGNYDPARFSNIADIGTLQTEFIIARNLNRVMLADFFSLSDARSALSQVKEEGYSGAYLIEYINGERYGRAR